MSNIYVCSIVNLSHGSENMPTRLLHDSPGNDTITRRIQCTYVMYVCMLYVKTPCCIILPGVLVWQWFTLLLFLFLKNTKNVSCWLHSGVAYTAFGHLDLVWVAPVNTAWGVINVVRMHTTTLFQSAMYASCTPQPQCSTFNITSPMQTSRYVLQCSNILRCVVYCIKLVQNVTPLYCNTA